ncbi:MAG TPA: DNA translocase FtsK [Ignavibacteria bacterium]|nr:DNA translocase FtsK [Ignavibacteria bacterium]
MAKTSKDEDFNISVEAKKQILGFFVLIAGVLLLLSIFSYTTNDEATLEKLNFFSIFRQETYSGTYPIQNWLGIAGAFVSQFFINNLFGYFSSIIGLLVIFAGILLIAKKKFRPYLFYFSYSVLLMVLLGSALGLLRILSGAGAISSKLSGTGGDFVATIFYKTTGSVGATVIIFLLLFVNIFLLINGSFYKSFERLKAFVNYLIGKSKDFRESQKQKAEAKKELQEQLKKEQEEKAVLLQEEANKKTAFTEALIKEKEKLKKIKYAKEEDLILEEQVIEEIEDPKVEPEIEPEVEEEEPIRETEINRPKPVEIAEVKETKKEIIAKPKQESDADLIVVKEKKTEVSETDINPENSNETEALSGIDEDDYIEETLDDYNTPGTDILTQPTREELENVTDEELTTNGRLLQEKLLKFGIEIEKVTATPGPVVTLYELVPAANVKLSKIESLQDDIALALKARGIRMIIPIPGKGTVGVEIPNSKAQIVRIKSILESPKYKSSNKILPIAFGKTIDGEVFIDDLAKMPHLLIAGATGSGKSVGINTIIASLLYKLHPSDLKFVMVDPKKIELNLYSKLKKHYLATTKDINESIVTSPSNAVSVLKSLVSEMEKRYDKLANAGVRNIEAYNVKYKDGKLKDNDAIRHKKMPYIVVIIDELADLMITAKREIEEPIARLAQMARAVGIHLIVATQRPSVDVITGVIKANFPVRIAYQVASKIDSRTILDMGGADALLRNGDMLYLSSASPKPIRIQNAYMSTEECELMVDYIGDQDGFKKLHLLPSTQENRKFGGDDDDRDIMFDDVARMILSMQTCSTSVIQRRMKLGYARAARIVDQLERAGIVGPNNGAKGRDILVTEDELEDILNG